ncbi:ubiquitin-like-specific protease ESD4 [Gossypium australe]|uniref:Ubiquitin-like-specific protease ESD4 n=1 Tax=Gossypium australe TaxID=47621 RepID=A0A5B6VFS6_9ROSI|nr:ubiquitin-like-specific protease ESD4 [Gossypium australe]
MVFFKWVLNFQGALASNRKRSGSKRCNHHFNHKNKTLHSNPLVFQRSKKLRFSSMDQSPEKASSSLNDTVSRLSRYPDSKLHVPKEVQAPVKHLKFGLSIPNPNHDFLSKKLSNAKKQAFGSFKYINKDKEVVTVEEDDEDSGSWLMADAFDKLSLNHSDNDLIAYNKLLKSAERRTNKLKDSGPQIKVNEKLKKSEVVTHELFVPLTKEELAEVSHAFSAENKKKILVSHEKLSIDIPGEVLQCLKPGSWLNDEVINLYLELLKERENREPKKFLKCHFFNTFFYKKVVSVLDFLTLLFHFNLYNYWFIRYIFPLGILVSSEGGCNYKAVKRWTSQRKLGYCLFDCDKIFVPIHKDIHWCLAVINKKDRKFQYLDSLRGRDGKVLNALANYFVEEVRDKSGEDIDISSWEREHVEDLPTQKNGFDCGMFMLKYIDFYSRGLSLSFGQSFYSSDSKI